MEVPCQSDITGQNLMLPPPPGTFQDREDLIKHVRDFGANQGYVATIKKSKRDRRVILGCDRGAIGKKDDDVWVLTIKNGEHNHEPLQDMSEHLYSHRFTEEEVWQIKLMTEAGIKPRQVLKALKESNPDLKLNQGIFTMSKLKSVMGIYQRDVLNPGVLICLFQ